MISTEAVTAISGIAVGIFGILCVLRASKDSIQSAEPDPERVRRFVESTPPIPEHLLKTHLDNRPKNPQSAEDDTSDKAPN